MSNELYLPTGNGEFSRASDAMWHIAAKPDPQRPGQMVADVNLSGDLNNNLGLLYQAMENSPEICKRVLTVVYHFCHTKNISLLRLKEHTYFKGQSAGQ